MARIGVFFAEVTASAISERDRRRIDATLRRIAIGESPGRWPERPSGILVTAVLTDGRSGAVVLRLEVRYGTQRLFRIAKLSSRAEARAEWAAFNRILRPVPSVLCPPIEAVTEGVLDSQFALPGEDEAVVYTDVEQFAAAATSNLEDLVAAAAERGTGDEAADVISRLLLLAGSVFYNQCQTTAAEQERLSANLSLGPDLRLAVERAGAVGRSPEDEPGSARSVPWLSPADILAAGAHLPGADESLAGTGEPRAGSAVALSGLVSHRTGERLVAKREYVSVEIGPGPELTGPIAATGLAAPFFVYGTIAGTRSALTWERIRSALPGIEITAGGTVRVHQTWTAHPFAILRRLLTEPVTGLVTGTVHGDLNPRNVLIAHGQPFLIDYARAGRDQPILGDFAWLEINLLRHPLSADLSFAELVKLQRLLALADRVAGLLPDTGHEAVDGALAAVAGPRLRSPIQILSTIRRHARLAYARAEAVAGKSAQPCWHEYLVQLFLAAHRTFKWEDALQAEGRMRAAVAAASVAAEQLDRTGNPWRLWDRADLTAATAAVLPLLPGAHVAVPVLASLVSGLDSVGTGPELDGEIQRARARMVTPAVAPRRMNELRADHDLYIDLAASVLAAERLPDASAVALASATAQAAVLGPSGAGKTALLGEIEYRLITSAAGRVPIQLAASDVAGATTGTSDPGGLRPLAAQVSMATAGQVSAADLLAAGAMHLMVDDFDRLPATGRAEVAAWLQGIRQRFPRTPVSVCHRGTAVPAELRGWTGILLREPGDGQIAVYLARFHAARGRTAAQAAALITSVHERGQWELARTPQLLWLLASAGEQSEPLVTLGDLVGAYIHVLESRSPGSRWWLRCAEALAEWQIASAGEAARDEVFLAAADPDVTAVWHSAREQLIRLGILAANGLATRFRLQIYADYFAARRLMQVSAESQEQLRELVLRFAWRDAFALFVSFSATTPSVLGGLVGAVADADPCFAARLLRFAANPPIELCDQFLTVQARLLRDPRAGPVAQARAAQALAEVASPAAFRRLLAVLSDPATDLAASEQSLIALVRAQSAHGAGGRQRRMTAELTARLGPVLATTAPPVLIAALQAVGDLELHGLELLVADHIRPSGSWPVIAGARAALRKLGVRLPVGLEDTYQRAQQARLAEVEHQLPDATSSAQANQLQRERYLLLTACQGPGRLPGLLERRFAFEIGAALAEFIDEAVAPAGHAPAAGTDGWQAIISGLDPTPEELLAVVGGADPLAAAAAAHRLLRDQPGLAGRLFHALAENGSGDRALIAAAAAALLPPERLPDLVDHFGRLLASAERDATPLDDLAAFAQVIFTRDAPTGIRLIWQAHRSLAGHRRADRLRWPWASAVARFGGTPAQLDALLSAGLGHDHVLALEALASSGFLITGGLPSAHQFSDAAHERLLRACREARADGSPAGGGMVVLLRAAAAMGVPEALDALFPARSVPSLTSAITGCGTTTAQDVSVPGLGVVEVAPAADALAALGYLGRLGTAAGGAASAAYRLLRDFDVSACHPSVAVGRLAGLGYLGDWRPALEALGSPDPRLPVVARNAVELGLRLPGPRTPPRPTDPAVVAGWIATRLGEPSLTPKARSVLMELKRSAEEHAGALTPAPARTGQTPA